MTVHEAFSLALHHHHSGDLAKAEPLYRQILSVLPHEPEVIHMLGVLLHQKGEDHSAEILLRQSLSIQPDNARALCNLGRVLCRLGRCEEAVGACRHAIELKPQFPEAHLNLGNALMGLGHLDDAILSLRRAIELDPRFAEAYSSLGNAFYIQRKLDEAIAAYRQAIELKSDFADAYSNLGVVLAASGRSDEAFAAYHRALEINPGLAFVHHNMGHLLRDQDRIEEAIAAYRQAIQLNPNYAEAYNDLGNALRLEGHFDEAARQLQRAIELKPDFALAHCALGNIWAELGRFDAAAIEYQKALQLQPERAEGGLDEARFSYALLLLRHGEFEQAWPLYESRWKLAEFEKRQCLAPEWDGRDVREQRVLIYAEQGLGDSIQFIRYAPLIAERGAEVIVECQPSLVSLLRSAKGVSQVFARGALLPQIDFHVAMLSQPLIFNTTPQTIPREIPYLFPEASRRENWRERLGTRQKSLRVGLTWTGHAVKFSLRKRNIGLEQLRPLLEVDGIDFYSLQIGPGSEQLCELPKQATVIDYTAHIIDFADTAALMSELNLIISVDTAVAHLAGALGRPVWTLLAFGADWRWGQEEYTPWYPTMRLFRQPALGDWSPVIQRVAGELKRLAATKLE